MCCYSTRTFLRWDDMKFSILIIGFFSLTLALGASVSAQDVRVIDGDTIQIEDTTFRLHGIDSPEAGQKCNAANGGTWSCGIDATNYLLSLIGNRTVTCDNRGIDDFDRVIGVCLTSQVELNAEMVEAGMAWAFRKFSSDYVASEDRARAKSVGIWQANTQTAEDFRAERWRVAAQESPSGCPIKGNISNNGRIYHPPWSPWYSRTKVSLEKGERWFCSEREALDAGWRAPIWGR